MSVLTNPDYSFPPEVWAHIFSFIDDADLIFDLEDVCTFFRSELMHKTQSIIPGNFLVNRDLLRKFRSRRAKPNTHQIDLDAKPLEFIVGLLGEMDIGKTCLYTAYSQKSAIFTNLVYGSGDRPLTTKARYENQEVHFKLVDLERFSGQFEPPRTDLSTVHGILLCYDVTKEASLAALFRFWLPYIVSKSPGNTVFFLVALKTELPDHARRISKTTGESIARTMRMAYWEVSSAQYYNVAQLFSSMHSAIVHEYDGSDPANPNSGKAPHQHDGKKNCSVM